MPRITVKTNVFLNREKKYRMTLEFKEAIELIPCEKGSFVMADFEDEAFMLFGDEAASDPCAAIEVAVIQDAFDKYGIDIPYPQRVVYLQNVDNSTGEIKGTKKMAIATNVAIDDSPEN